MSAFVENPVVRCSLLRPPITCTEGAPERCATCPHRDTQDLVTSKCDAAGCCWRACGFRSAVEIAERAHIETHARLARHAPRQASPRSGVLADVSRLPWPFPRFHIALTTLLSTALVGWLAMLSRWLHERLNYPRPFGIPLHALFMLCVVASLVWIVMEWWSHWRRENIRRLWVVAECNHEIRNALDLIILAAHSEEGIRQINHAVQRIESTLVDILPAVNGSSVATYSPDRDSKSTNSSIVQSRAASIARSDA